MYNPYIVVPLATWAIAQVLKFALAAFQGRLDFKYLYASGGMPSVHSAVVTSMAVTALLVDGGGSHLFGFTAVFAVIVIYDSLGVRRAAGDQAVALNLLMADVNKGKAYKPLREVLGHTPGEVTAGAILGAVLAIVFSYDRIGWLTSDAMALPNKSENLAYAITGAVIVLLGIIVRIILPILQRESKAIKRVAKALFRVLEGTGWLVLLASLLEYEQASYLAWRLWPVLILATGGILLVTEGIRAWRRLPVELAQEAEMKRKAKWFAWGKTRKKSKKA